MTWKHQDFNRTMEEFTSKHGALICFNYNQQKLIFNQGKRMNCTALASLYITSSDLEYLAATAGFVVPETIVNQHIWKIKTMNFKEVWLNMKLCRLIDSAGSQPSF